MPIGRRVTAALTKPLVAAGKAKYPSGERYVGHWHQGKKQGYGKWTSAPKAVAFVRTPPHPREAEGTETTGEQRTHITAGASRSGSSSSQEVRETYVGWWVADKRDGQGVAEYADGGR